MRKVAVSFLFLVFFMQGVNSQDQTLRFISLPDGISNNFIKQIYKDDYGIMWFGTLNGLNAFNGYEYKIYENNPGDTNTLSNNNVTRILRYQKGNMWISTYGGGLNFYNREKDNFIPYLLDEEIYGHLSNNINYSIYYNNDTIIVGTESGLFLFSIPDKRYRKIDLPKEYSNLYITSMVLHDSTELWIASIQHGLLKYCFKTHSIESFKPRLELNPRDIQNVRAVFVDSKNYLWVAYLNYKLVRVNLNNPELRAQSLQELFHEYDLPETHVLSIYEDKNQFLWFGTENQGLLRINPYENKISIYSKQPDRPYSLPNNSIYAIFEDQNNIMWIGTFNSGVCFVDPLWNKFDDYIRFYEKINLTIDYSSVTSVKAIHDETLIATDGYGIFKIMNKEDYRTEQINNFTVGERLGSNHVLTLGEVDDKLWIGAWDGGINIGSIDLTESSIRKNIYSNNHVFNILEDRDKNIWIATWGEGLYFHPSDGSASINLRISDNPKIDIGSNNIFSVYEDSQGNIWSGTLNGLVKILKRKNTIQGITKYSHRRTDSTSIASDAVLSLYEDSESNLWIGTSAGLNLYNRQKDEFIYYNNELNLKTYEVKSIIEDDNQFLWLGTNKGLVRFNKKSGVLRIFDKSDGLITLEYNVNAAEKIDELMIFGSTRGILAFNPNRIINNPLKPQVIFSDFKIFNESIQPGKNNILKKNILLTNSIKLSHRDNVFTIEFSAINYTHPEKNQYAYRLKGLENNWNYVGNKRSVTYSNLRHGTYTFMVIASNNDGEWNDTPKELEIVITPPFWKTWWFKLAVGIVIIWLIYAVYKSRIGDLRQRLQFKENQLKLERWKEEQRLLELEHKKLGTELDTREKELAKINMQYAQQNAKLFTIRDQILDIMPNASKENYKKLIQLRKSIEKDINNSQSWKQFETSINLTHDNFLQRITDKYTNITHNDLKLIAYIRMNLDNKEIADLLNITLRSVESSRYRLRKKMGLDKNTNLNDYIIRY